MSRPRLTQQQRDQRRDAQRQQLQSAVEALLSSDGWARWVRVRATNGLGRYSYNNQLLIAAQTGGQATYVCGFRRWQQLGFAVRKGQKAIWILAPHVTKRNDTTPSSETEREQRRLYFRAVPVFDRAAVDAIPGVKQAQLHPPQQPLGGDSHAHLLDRLAAFASELGYGVAFQEIPGQTGGWCDANAKQIVVDDAEAPNAQVRILTPWRRVRIPTVGMPGCFGVGMAAASPSSSLCGLAEGWSRRPAGVGVACRPCWCDRRRGAGARGRR